MVKSSIQALILASGLFLVIYFPKEITGNSSHFILIERLPLVTLVLVACPEGILVFHILCMLRVPPIRKVCIEGHVFYIDSI